MARAAHRHGGRVGRLARARCFRPPVVLGFAQLGTQDACGIPASLPTPMDRQTERRPPSGSAQAPTQGAAATNSRRCSFSHSASRRRAWMSPRAFDRNLRSPPLRQGHGHTAGSAGFFSHHFPRPGRGGISDRGLSGASRHPAGRTLLHGHSRGRFGSAARRSARLVGWQNTRHPSLAPRRAHLTGPGQPLRLPARLPPRRIGAFRGRHLHAVRRRPHVFGRVRLCASGTPFRNHRRRHRSRGGVFSQPSKDTDHVPSPVTTNGGACRQRARGDSATRLRDVESDPSQLRHARTGFPKPRRTSRLPSPPRRPARTARIRESPSRRPATTGLGKDPLGVVKRLRWSGIFPGGSPSLVWKGWRRQPEEGSPTQIKKGRREGRPF